MNIIKHMKNMRVKDLGDYSIAKKLNIFFLLLVMVPLLFLGGVVLESVKDIQLKQVYRETEQYLVQSEKAIINSLTELDNIIISNLWNHELEKFLNKESQYISSPEEKNTVTSILRGIANARKDINVLALKANNGEEFIYSISDSAPQVKAEIRRLEERGQWSQGMIDKYNHGKTIWIASSQEQFFVGIRQIRDFESLEVLGIFYVFIDEASLRQEYEQMTDPTTGFFVIWDELDNVISENSNMENVEVKNSISHELNGKQMQLAGSKYYCDLLENENLGWKIGEYVLESKMMEPIHKMELVILCIILIVFGVLSLLIDKFSKSLTRPIHNLNQKMEEVRNENFDVVAVVEHRDEIGQLTESFNSMTYRIKELIEKDYQSKLLLQETEYKFLRAQINPHFLYNTLDSISWMAALSGNKQVSKMSVALGQILRWSISNKDNIVSLKEEVENVEAYLAIQKIRYGETLSSVTSIEEETEKANVPKMILQPLVENALIHGLENKTGNKCIVIESSVDNEQLIIQICDNGCGMSEEKIQKVLNGEINQENNHGVGVFNVNKRIQMLCGENYGLKITSVVDKGTEIEIRLPLGIGEQNENQSNDCRG